METIEVELEKFTDEEIKEHKVENEVVYKVKDVDKFLKKVKKIVLEIKGSKNGSIYNRRPSRRV